MSTRTIQQKRIGRKLLDFGEVHYISYKTEPKAVVLDIARYTKMLEIMEDYADIKAAQELAKEPRGEGIRLEDINI